MNKNIQFIQGNKFLKDNIDTVGRLLKDNKLVLEFIVEILKERAKSTETLKDDDPNWLIKRAIRDGRMRELEFLKDLFKDEEK